MNHLSPVTKVNQIVTSILTEADNGSYSKNDRLLSITEYSKKLGVARETIEKAYNKLKAEGYIASVAGRGHFYIGKPDLRAKVLFVFNKLSPYKKMIYDAFIESLGKAAKVDIVVHHYSPDLLKEIVESNLGKYHYYVVMPHFFNHVPDSQCHEILASIPSQKLILLDKNIPEFDEASSAVYQDFTNDIYEALTNEAALLKKYKSITVIFPEHSNHPTGINNGIRQFCREQGLGFSIVGYPAEIALNPSTLYIALSDADLAVLIKRVRQSQYKLGHELGIISFNETELKELLDITVITTDFSQMGRTAAEIILKKRQANVRNPFIFIHRSSV